MSRYVYIVIKSMLGGYLVYFDSSSIIRAVTIEDQI